MNKYLKIYSEHSSQTDTGWCWKADLHEWRSDDHLVVTPVYVSDSFNDLIQVIYEDDYQGELSIFGRFYSVERAMEL